MNVFKEIENSLCMLVTYLPPILIALVPFKDKLRFSKGITSLLIVGLCVSELLLLQLNVHVGLTNRILLPISLLLCSVLALSAIKAHPGKIMFTIILLSNMTNCVSVVSIWLEKVLFGTEAAMLNMNYTNVLSTLIVAAVIIPPIYFYFDGVYREGMSRNVNNAAWKYLWVIPTTF